LDGGRGSRPRLAEVRLVVARVERDVRIELLRATEARERGVALAEAELHHADVACERSVRLRGAAGLAASALGDLQAAERFAELGDEVVVFGLLQRVFGDLLRASIGERGRCEE